MKLKEQQKNLRALIDSKYKEKGQIIKDIDKLEKEMQHLSIKIFDEDLVMNGEGRIVLMKDGKLIIHSGRIENIKDLGKHFWGTYYQDTYCSWFKVKDIVKFVSDDCCYRVCCCRNFHQCKNFSKP